MLAGIVGDKVQMGNCITDSWTQTGVHYVTIRIVGQSLKRMGQSRT